MKYVYKDNDNYLYKYIIIYVSLPLRHSLEKKNLSIPISNISGQILNYNLLAIFVKHVQ